MKRALTVLMLCFLIAYLHTGGAMTEKSDTRP